MVAVRIACYALFSVTLVSAAIAQGVDTERLTSHFETHIRPVLATTCIQCHGVQKQEGGLRLDSREAMIQGGESGPAVVLGHPNESLLVSALQYDELEMPPDDPLESAQIQAFATWIQDGVWWPTTTKPLRAARARIVEGDREWWAFRRVSKCVPPPKVATAAMAANEIDGFVHRKLATQNMHPAPAADRITLVRRVYQDLIGLPPEPEEVDSFLADQSPNAWEKLIDVLLADERYGEHWARFWLDLVRYAESDGWNADAYRPHAWRYRDYVVRAFNSDKPYPEFVREQLAGDELDQPTPDSLAATGYLRLGIFEYNQRNARQHWDDILNEMTDVTGDVFLGMGLACARCHDHKYDPILQVDYFKLRAFFEPLVFADDTVYATRAEQTAWREQQNRWLKETKSIRESLAAIERPYNEKKRQGTIGKFPLDIQSSYFKPAAERNSWDQQMFYFIDRQFVEEGSDPLASMTAKDKKSHAALLAELKAYDHLKPEPLPKLMAATNHCGEFASTTVPGTDEIVSPGFLRVLSHVAGPEYPECEPRRRTALADWITSPANPLTTRVIVNRIWKQHFGRGLVRSVNDFGTLGGEPTHPELLDWLVHRFIEDGWQWKRLHKHILMSATWRQSTSHELAEDYQQIDPGNKLLWRREVRRLTAEQIRDAMLCASGELSLDRGGPSVEGNSPHRSVYVKSIRNTPDRFLHAFDVANGLKSVGQRDTTTTPTQALMMINGEYVLQRAEQMANRLSRMWDEDDARVRQAIRSTWNREPDDMELAKGLEFIHADSTDERHQNLIDFCHLLLNSNEFLYVD